jgi:hypothetical protein
MPIELQNEIRKRKQFILLNKVASQNPNMKSLLLNIAMARNFEPTQMRSKCTVSATNLHFPTPSKPVEDSSVTSMSTILLCLTDFV